MQIWHVRAAVSSNDILHGLLSHLASRSYVSAVKSNRTDSKLGLLSIRSMILSRSWKPSTSGVRTRKFLDFHFPQQRFCPVVLAMHQSFPAFVEGFFRYRSEGDPKQGVHYVKDRCISDQRISAPLAFQQPRGPPCGWTCTLYFLRRKMQWTMRTPSTQRESAAVRSTMQMRSTMRPTISPNWCARKSRKTCPGLLYPLCSNGTGSSSSTRGDPRLRDSS
mmetsp:Transcript_56332/g.115208  ORF Transcript_56332/g.115208 Transcript_56332/m.115208 type:complete len:220 (+) Transcript_56332:2-661(+)